MFWHTVIGVSLLKLLAIPSWYDSDLQVHLNWMAVTHSVPFFYWYATDCNFPLNYPPFFIWFEWLLGFFAKLVDPEMVVFRNASYRTFSAVAFQRTSVVVTDLTMAYGASVCAKALGWDPKKKWLLTAVTFTNAGLFLVDHVFFHYTGILQGLFLTSIGYEDVRVSLPLSMFFLLGT